MHLSAKGVPEFVTPNELIFPPAIEVELDRAAQTYWHPQRQVPLPVKPAWIVNTCGDADSFSRALQLLDDSYTTVTPVFNHPRAVMAARRDIVGLYLRDIPGLDVPRCRRFRAIGPQSVSECFDQGMFRYPVAVQQTTARNATGRMWIADAQDLDTAIASHGGAGRWHVMVQSHADEATTGTTLRLAFAGRFGTVVALPQSAPEGTADPVMMPSKDFLQAILKLAIKRMPLDFWTMDVLMVAPDRLRVLDVSAGLHIPGKADRLPLIRKQTRQLGMQLAPRLLALLGDPARWRGDSRELPSVAALKDLHGA